MKRIGIVGAGVMASGMALNFLKNGYSVIAWNRNPERLLPLRAKGALASESPKELASQSDIVIECVSDDDASRHVWLDHEGILAGAHASAVLITSASLSLEWVDELAGVCASKGLKLLDMPLTGGRGGAESGQLSLLVGGDKAVLDSIADDLSPIAEHIYHFGAVGAGMRFKLMLNALSAIHLTATAQAAALAEKAGIDRDMFFHAMFNSKMGPASPAAGLLVRDKDLPMHAVNFSVELIEKDLRYAQDMATRYHARFNHLDNAHASFEHAKTHGLANADWTKITELYYRGHK